MKYRSDQINIISYTNGTMAIPAVPGAGKTFVLTHLVGKLILEGKHKPGKILILSYMTSSCSNIKSRILDFLEDKGINSCKDFEVMTIHSLAMKIIKEKPDFLNLSDEFKIIDSVTQVSLITHAVKRFKDLKRNEFDNFININKDTDLRKVYNSVEESFVRAMNSFIGELKSIGISAEKLNDITKDLDKTNILRLASYVYQEYDIYLKKNGLLDYDDLLYFAYKLLKEDEYIKNKFQSRYKYIFEDECQDSNKIQGKILEILSQKYGNLVRVGDLNQSITGTFTSSSPELFSNFCKTANKLEKMFTAGRSSKQIIDLANYLVNWVRKEHPVKQCTNALENQMLNIVPEGEKPENPKPSNYGIRVYIENSWEDEIERFINLYKKYVQKYPDKTIAALIPTGNMIMNVSDKLRKNNIDYDELSDISSEKLETATILSKILKYIHMPYDNEMFEDIFKNIFIKNETTEDIILYEYIRKCNLEDIIYPSSQISFPDDIKNLSIYEQFIEYLDLIRNFLNFPQISVDKLILYIGEKLNFDREQRAIVQNIAYDLKILLKSNPKWTIKDIADELGKSKNNRFNYFAKFVYDMKGYTPTKGKVTLSTLHKAKGLEWDCVFILGITSSNFPVKLTDRFLGENRYLKKEYANPLASLKDSLKKALNEKTYEDPLIKSRQEVIAEKARLLYVGITRAKETLILMSHKTNKEVPSLYINHLKNFIESEKIKYDRH
ncbi:DNA helicase-2 / ATP-dependent DNA helicase PcrA [Alkalithermobacter thermoalcaliphilus JW-YL-7 = DSM 7308]|uniref:DNA 3'-5' helicase n=1 Tax=Alkalithermobacter thermoalcaliphilus JW-YL-7 = DSM 7308 TaxID=1121328 RepID=A0A150FPE7_CLOPD|nr:Helicase superfamily 1 UvrD-related protein [[Clostridium] paradoxum JW-YL-7 = DSM 7308]SHK49304.1 DNA helicase-2 / ATP-dependent DNA helicase PcrA [[Clostridium] paradoxum JW-YL-7 = DSM 7308]